MNPAQRPSLHGARVFRQSPLHFLSVSGRKPPIPGFAKSWIFVQEGLAHVAVQSENGRMAGQDILLDYFAMLERRGFEITVNDFSGLLVSDPEQSALFAPWFIHRNPFCMKIKSDARLWNECLRKKTALCAAASKGSPFRGMCFCGREEHIMPVMKDGIVLATIGLGGFVSDRDAGLAKAALNMGERLESTRELYDSASPADPPGEEDAEALLGLAAAELLRRYERLEAGRGALVLPEAARLSRERRLALHAADWLRKNSGERVFLREAAAACHVSASTLSHVFKKCMGRSVAAWLSDLRIAKAKTLLERGATVTEAAIDSGFEDPNYFSRVFAKAEGLPPGRWSAAGTHAAPPS